MYSCYLHGHFLNHCTPWPHPFSIHARHLTIFNTLIHPSLNLSLHTPPHPVSMPNVLIKPNLHPSYPLSAPITMPLPPNPYSHTHLLHHVSFTFIYPLLSLNLHAFVPMQAQFRHPSLKPKKSVNHPWWHTLSSWLPVAPNHSDINKLVMSSTTSRFPFPQQAVPHSFFTPSSGQRLKIPRVFGPSEALRNWDSEHSCQKGMMWLVRHQRSWEIWQIWPPYVRKIIDWWTFEIGLRLACFIEIWDH